MNKNIIVIDGYPVAVDNESKNWLINWFRPGCFIIKGKYQGNSFKSSVLRDGNKYNVNINGSSYTVEPSPQDYFSEQDKLNNYKNKTFSPMTGIIKDILVKEGELISSGQLLFRIESMKLVLSVNASDKGTIKDMRVKPGQKVSAGDLILEIDI